MTDSGSANDGGHGARRFIARIGRYWLLGGAGLLAAAVVAVLAAKSGRWRSVPNGSADPFPLSALASSPFLNAVPPARYLGSEACRSCHKEAFASFRHTGMGRSMALVDLDREPVDAEFDHPLSKRRYQVRRKDGQLWHRELLLTGGAEEVLLCEHPLKYVVGSGRHSLTYLVEVDGFLVESPVTWYAARKAWGMSPGYDDARQPGFQRATGEKCLFCHAGQSEAIDQSWHRMRVPEAAIGCERCHGPGSLHVAHHSKPPNQADSTAGEIDYTIVNPASLSRELAEAVCQQCHLRPTTLIVARGRKPTDFRPGLPLQDFLHPYWLVRQDSTMTVVGHVEQMHLSRCYKESNTLTCLTCHNPHEEPSAENSAAYYRSICVSCHKPQRCTVSQARLARESPTNDCVHCHMPRSQTEIPHLAFTHHRIGIHEKPGGVASLSAREGRMELRPFFDLSGLSDIDQKRSLGLSFLEVADQEKDIAQKQAYQQQALELLDEVWKKGLRDAQLDAGLGRLRFDVKREEVLPCAESALTHPDLSGVDRCNALSLIANVQVREGKYEEAIQTLHLLTQRRRNPIDWLLLGDCEAKRGDPAAAEKAMSNAVRINPRLWMVHEHLAQYHQRQGNLKQADWHKRRAVP